VLSTKVKEETCKLFMEMLLKTKDVKYFKLLEAVFICNDEVIINHQSTISNFLFESDSALQTLYFPIQNKGTEIVLIFNKR
jgi:hypothetical protein